ncbi:MAG TPA: thioredoxin domain-containing protein [Candidatus Saccharimonadales bacterium]|nr:thioredoxin domain-containing protein [Candidatus Saccharimonadales bacterium]
MDKRFLGILAAIVIIFVVIFTVTQNSSSNSNGNGSGAQPTSHVKGQGSTGVKLVEYGDYECPICEEYYPILNQVAQKFTKQIHFQFRNLPLTQIHPNAFAAARAAEAAGLQAKYWQMHDKLYTNQSTWASASNPVTYFDTYAQQIGLNMDQFKNDYSSSKVNDAINADLNAFSKTGKPEATPTFFLDGQYIDNTRLSDPNTGQPSVTLFSQVLNAEIAKKTGKS